MSYYVPLIRADVIAPALRWMSNHGRDVDAALRAVNLDWYPWDDPHATIPVKNGAHFFFNLGRSEGPDIAFRVVAETGVLDIGLLGSVIAQCSTPRSALILAAEMMPYQCTHELLVVSRGGATCTVSDNWAFLFKDQETRHMVQQYVLALIDMICRATGQQPPRLEKVRMVPHPEHGLAHLHPWIGCETEADVNAPLSTDIPAAVADHAFLEQPVEAGSEISIPTLLPLRGDGSMAGCITLLVRSMMRDGAPDLDRVAALVGSSRRTLQRRLASDGVTFSDVVEMVRRDLASEALSDPRIRLQDLSESLGYSHQSTLTRAVRRWTGLAPTVLRVNRTC